MTQQATKTDERARLPHLTRLYAVVRSWFAEDQLRDLLGVGDSLMERISLEWLAGDGKRWRPFLVVSTWQALDGRETLDVPETIRNMAIAVECIHKASLIYDDIQDGDAQRYGERTVHTEHGVPVALTSSLYLLGHGYRLIAESPAPPERHGRMMQLMTQSHCELCVGQGRELSWMRRPEPLKPAEVLDIFRQKTAPSFEAVFCLPGAYVGIDEKTDEVLRRYSAALGIAYQVRDDLDDFHGRGDVDDVDSRRPAIVTALAWDTAEGERCDELAALWCEERQRPAQAERMREIIEELGAAQKAKAILEDCKRDALAALDALDNDRLRRQLTQIALMIFGGK